MARYIFENMSQTDAGNFTTGDELFFLSASVSTVGVVDTPSDTVTGPLGTTITNETIALTSGGKTLTFGAAVLSSASKGGDVIFFNSDVLLVGTDAGADTLDASVSGVAGHGSALYGFGGADTLLAGEANDTLNGGAGNDVLVGSSSTTDTDGHFTESDYYMGGDGADSIVGGEGNDHIYGNLFSSTAGATDGADTIAAGDGNDYVNGNAGNDLIHGENDNDRLYGGAGADTVTGDAGNDYLQGNKGNDVLSGGADNDTIHGGADNDTITGDAGNDQIFGDNGNDSITGGAGYDTVWGGAGNDVFVFAANDAPLTHVIDDTTATGHGLVDTIGDFTDGADTIALGFVPTALVHTGPGVTFTDAHAAYTYAQQLIDASTGAHATTVAAITVGTDTYLFYDDTHSTGTIDAAIKVTGVADTVFNVGTGSDFV